MLKENTEIDKKDPLLRRAIYYAFDGKCFYTGRDVSFDDMHIDHILPQSEGGPNNVSNYVLSCGYINLKKFNKVNPKLIEISREVVNLCFSEKVVLKYNELQNNQKVVDTHIELNSFLNKNINCPILRTRFRSYVRYYLTPIKIYKTHSNGLKAKKPKLYYNVNELNELYSSWSETQDL